MYNIVGDYMKVVVIGAGASGVIAALNASINNEVILLEKNDKVAKKILVTGNGKCNLWNASLCYDNLNVKEFYNTDDYKKLESIMKYRFDTFEFLKNDLNIYMKNKGEYIYPYSLTSSSIRETFEKSLSNVIVKANFEVNKIEKKNNEFYIYGSELIKCDKVILACGNKASNLGTNTIDILEDIKINKPLPALVPLVSNFKYLKDLKGLRCDVTLSLDNFKEKGEIQFTEYGISGIVTFNLSSKVSKMLKYNDYVKMNIDFMSELSNEDLYTLFEMNFKGKKKSIEELLETFFNYKLLFVLLDISKINRSELYDNLTKEEKLILVNNIKNLEISVTNTLTIDKAQVATGGVSLEEVNDTLELNKIPGMYVTGEALDVDGKCGGFNLAFAFITGYIAGRSC